MACYHCTRFIAPVCRRLPLQCHQEIRITRYKSPCPQVHRKTRQLGRRRDCFLSNNRVSQSSASGSSHYSTFRIREPRLIMRQTTSPSGSSRLRDLEKRTKKAEQDIIELKKDVVSHGLNKSWLIAIMQWIFS